MEAHGVSWQAAGWEVWFGLLLIPLKKKKQPNLQSFLGLFVFFFS